ncbi:hypothetical protein [Methylotenera mobilis]|uniref:Uncharacterized protein n=1 Tax=Methylotenera mobilis (strain JLW8 / ATCC BAA-1282 / DSM 17540) TaxID=583345 RepID=C6WSQ1_METML|nr:hypothetical protein [Methylotenera mobilis]ACT47143.1 conserved hypothetical protein [Methylotenera mobilis JLW8]
MAKSTNELDKGYKMEELLRSYFLQAGYYVVRGVPFVYEGFDVTDIDVWLYGRASSVSREITIVDSKNKKTPQAIERIFWVQGLKIATKATNAIVATNDRRQAVKDFGKEMGIPVLDGLFLGKLKKFEESSRLTEEEYFKKIDDYALSKIDGDWRGRMQASKSLLAKGLSFDSCNEWLLNGRFFAEQVITKPNQREVALRSLYLICSYIAVAVDYILREYSFLEQAERSALIKDGFSYGSKGSSGFQKILNVTMGLVEQHAKDGLLISKQVRSSVNRQLTTSNTEILGDFFSKNEVAKTLFTVAKELEALAMQRNFLSHATSSVELRSLLLCLIDFWAMDRVLFSESLR